MEIDDLNSQIAKLEKQLASARNNRARAEADFARAQKQSVVSSRIATLRRTLERRSLEVSQLERRLALALSRKARAERAARNAEIHASDVWRSVNVRRERADGAVEDANGGAVEESGSQAPSGVTATIVWADALEQSRRSREVEVARTAYPLFVAAAVSALTAIATLVGAASDVPGVPLGVAGLVASIIGLLIGAVVLRASWNSAKPESASVVAAREAWTAVVAERAERV